MTQKKKHGRPTKYSNLMLQAALQYMDTWKEKGDAVPTVVGLAMACDVATNTIYNWVGKGRDDTIVACEQFCRLFDLIEQQQHQALVNNGLWGSFNPAITKMMLTKHGYSDKQEVDHRSPDGSMSPRGSNLDDFYKKADVSTQSES